MTSTQETFACDVLVVGAGPVGLTLAVDLARRGISVRIIDKAQAPAAESRALAIHPRTLGVMEHLEVLDEAQAQGRRLSGARFVSEGRELAHIRLDGLEGSFPYSLNLEQSRTERILQWKLEGLNVAVRREVALKGIEQDASGATAQVVGPDGKPEAIRCRYLVGCDGARSVARRLLGLSFEGSTEEESYLLADCQVTFDKQPPPSDEMTAFLGANSRLIIGPLTPPLWRVIVTLPNDDPRMPEGDPTLDQVQSIVAADNPDSGIRFSQAVWLSHFKVNTRMVDRFRAGRCFVAGDAAHIHSPTAGQGMNTGMQDAFNLGWKLAAALRGTPNAEKLLDSYDAERRPIGARILRATHTIDILITGKHGPLFRKARNVILELAAEVGPLRKQVMRWLAGSGVDYPESPIIAKDTHQPFPRAGDVAPDADDLVAPDGKHGTLNRILAGELCHNVFVVPGSSRNADVASLQAHVDELNATAADVLAAYLVMPKSTSIQPSAPSVLTDLRGSFSTRFNVGSDGLLLVVRPDGYVSLRASPTDFSRVVDIVRDPTRAA